MALDAEQIERVREVIRFTSYAATETLLSSLNEAQVAATESDLSEWQDLRSDFVDIDSTVKISAAHSRLVIRNRVRERLGLARLTLSEELAGTCGGGEVAYSHPVIKGVCS